MDNIDSRGFPVLDLSMLQESRVKTCVRCYSRSDARHFLSAMMDQYPEKCTSWHWPSNVVEHHDFLTESIDMYPDLNDIERLRLEYTEGEDYADDHGYYIIEFDDIVRASTPNDFGDIEVSDISIYDLFA